MEKQLKAFSEQISVKKSVVVPTSSSKNPQPYLKPAENPTSYRPNLLNQASVPQNHSTPPSVKPTLICHRYGLVNHFAKDCQAADPPKPKVKDFVYYTRHDQELAESEKAFVDTASWNVYGYWSSGDEKEEDGKNNLCFMERHIIECDYGYWSSRSDGDDDA